jgi:hypothetical protein
MQRRLLLAAGLICATTGAALDMPEFEAYVQGDVRRMAEVVKKMGKVQ